MGNCLLTKLKAGIQNDALPILGAIKFNVSIDSRIEYNQESFYFRSDNLENSGKVINVKIVGDGFFRTSRTNPTSLGKELSISQPTEIFPSYGNYKIVISPYYDIRTLAMYANSIDGISIIPEPEFNVSQLYYMDDLSAISGMRFAAASLGEFATVYRDKSLTILTTQDNTYGDVEDLGINHKWTTLDLHYSLTIGGDFCTTLQTMWETRKSGTVTVIFPGGAVRLGRFGTPDNGDALKCTFSNSGIVVTNYNQTETICTFDGTSWS